MKSNKKVVFLYTELAGYITTCMERLAATGVEVHVFAYPVNTEAPFEFSDNRLAHYYNRKDFNKGSLHEKLNEISPNLVVCSGWIDDSYVAICKQLPENVTKVLALDNGFSGTIKSWVSVMRARLKFKSVFDLAWVPGDPQWNYAERMGFEESEIYGGFYTADSEKLGSIKWKNEKIFPKRFVFVGRYLAFKGVREMWNAFLNLPPNDWDFICAGQGALYEKRTQAAGIKHLGFVQPDEIENLMAEGGVFVLPSHKEPWGVVVHEFTSAGFPLICTKEVGAATAFLENDKNGYLIPAKSQQALAKAMNEILGMSDEQLFAFSERSRELAQRITIENWIETLTEIFARNE